MPPSSGGLLIQIVGDDKGVQTLLKRLEWGFSPIGMSVYLGGVVGPYLQERAERRFSNEGDDVSGKWAQLKPATQKIRSEGNWAVGPAHPINRRTGELQEYITGTKGDAVPMGVMAQLTFPDPQRAGGTRLRDKVKTAQKGSPNPKTVARPVLGLNSTDLTFVLTSLAFYASRIAKGGRR